MTVFLVSMARMVSLAEMATLVPGASRVGVASQGGVACEDPQGLQAWMALMAGTGVWDHKEKW